LIDIYNLGGLHVPKSSLNNNFHFQITFDKKLFVAIHFDSPNINHLKKKKKKKNTASKKAELKIFSPTQMISTDLGQ
jgi:hypothetical protein